MGEDGLFRISPQLVIPRGELEFEYARSGGPGGQNVNKVNSKATLRWSLNENQTLPDGVKSRLRTLAGRRLTDEGELLIVGQRYRDQPKNVEDCLERLRELVLQASVVQKRRIKTNPTRGSVQRRLNEKKAGAQKKQSRRKQFGDE